VKCLMKYKWVKLRRDMLPAGKGIMASWARLAARAAFRKGQASYCGHNNAVSPGMWTKEYSRRQKPRTSLRNA